MAIIEKLAVLSDAQAIDGDAASENYFDTGETTPDGSQYFLCIRTNTAPVDSSDTIAIELQHDPDSGFGTGPYVAMVICAADTTEITVSDSRFATAGAWIYRATIPMECNTRYWRLYYENTTNTGAITLDAWIEQMPQNHGTQVITSNVGNPSVA